MNTPDRPRRPASPGDADAIETAASEWLALREERPLAPAEQAAFDTWLAADPRHAAAVAELSAAWQTFDGLRAYPHPAAAPADPDFFTRPPAFRRRFAAWSVAAAALLVVGTATFVLTRTTAPDPAPAVAAANRILRLADGSEIELKPGSRVTTHLTATERRVHLVRGEAYFSVARDPARPFVVEADRVAVRALGTAFNVRLAGAAVEVLLTEGQVQVAGPAAAAAAAPLLLVPGQRTLVPTAATAETAPAVESLAPAEIDRALAWQTSRLAFDATPLAEVVAQFNRHHGRTVLTLDPALAALPVSGRFRAGNVDSFVELLESGFSLAVERGPGGDVLLRRASEKKP